MFEYSNLGVLIMGSVALFSVFLVIVLASGKAQSEQRPSKAPYIGFPIMILIAIFIYLDSYTTKNTIDKNIALFKNAKELKCLTLGSTYLVSKQRGWKLHNGAFIKDSLSLDARYCEE